MNGLHLALALSALAALLSIVRIVRGPDRATRVVGAELLTVCVVALIALGGLVLGSTATLDLVLVATLVAFLATVSFARALTGGHR